MPHYGDPGCPPGEGRGRQLIALVVMTDGRRDCVVRTVASFNEQVTGPVTRRIIHDDSGDGDYRHWLKTTFPGFELAASGRRQGYARAYAHAWEYVARGRERFVFGLEDDFLFQRPVDLAEMATVLDNNPHVAQLALRRQPWNEAEHAAGGVVELNPDAYTEVADDAGRRWLEHRLFWTSNPALYRRGVCEMGWPTVPQSEGQWTHFLLKHGMGGTVGADVRFGYWGGRDSGVWVHHIGDKRVGMGY